MKSYTRHLDVPTMSIVLLSSKTEDAHRERSKSNAHAQSRSHDFCHDTYVYIIFLRRRSVLENRVLVDKNQFRYGERCFLTMPIYPLLVCDDTGG